MPDDDDELDDDDDEDDVALEEEEVRFSVDSLDVDDTEGVRSAWVLDTALLL